VFVVRQYLFSLLNVSRTTNTCIGMSHSLQFIGMSHSLQFIGMSHSQQFIGMSGSLQFIGMSHSLQFIGTVLKERYFFLYSSALSM
jgi:predicted DNA-binding transcriptional regulator AlpA